jgi:AcrR family transcriptional regulator
MDDEARPRDRVLGVAMEIIAEKGLDQLRLAEIARRTNMSSGHVLYYFGTKDRILRETLLWTEDGLARQRRDAIAAAKPGWPQLLAYIDIYLPHDHKSPVWALWVESWARRHASSKIPPLRETAAAWEHDLAAILDRGRQAGEFSGGLGTFPQRLDALMNGLAVQILEQTRKIDEVRELVIEQCRIELGGGRAPGARPGRTARPATTVRPAPGPRPAKRR